RKKATKIFKIIIHNNFNK
uniref:Uncharacterized protein n=1 Tax=Amphimedon queenslandica TaxID=400682 RepID=A0A1X7UWW2_AMPQE